MKRICAKELTRWNSKSRRKPLILMGARQVGKTWLAKDFARKEYPKSTVMVDLMRDKILCSKIDSSDLSPKILIDIISAFTGKKIEPGKSLLIIDEIQESPNALAALKYFCEEMPDLAIIAAGSLLGIAVDRKGSFPVGKVNFLDVPPMSFNEFLLAMGEDARYEQIEHSDWDGMSIVGESFISLLRKYFYVGGMPEAVSVFAATGDYRATREIHNEILRAYDEDFVKHAPKNLLPRIRLLWNNIPAQLAKENKKFIYKVLKEGARAREYEAALQWLNDAGMIHQVYRVAPPRLPLDSYQDFAAFKLYMHDVGLLGALSGLGSSVLINGNELFTNFKGSMTEQYVLQELTARGIKPYYWSSDSGNAEVEFILQGNEGAYPLEVKATTNTRAKSLKTYREMFKPTMAFRTSLNPYHTSEGLYDIPLYAIAENIATLIS